MVLRGRLEHRKDWKDKEEMNTKTAPEALEVPAERKTLTVPEVGKALGIGRNQAYEAVRKGLIPSLKIGKRLLVPKAALDRLLAEGN